MKRISLKHSFMIAFVFILHLNYNLGVKHSSLNIVGVPLKSDLSAYLNSLERVLKICVFHKEEINLNLYMGLFLLNVNLKYVVINKRPGVPKKVEARLKQMLNTNNFLIKFAQTNSIKITSSGIKGEGVFLTLFRNVDSWVQNIPRFDSDNHEVRWKWNEELRQKYSSLREYRDRVNSYEKPPSWPNPELSTLCLTSVFDNPVNNSTLPYKCALLEECYGPIENGTAFGYIICHRLLTLMAARNSRGCYLYTPRVDREITASMCSAMFDEAQYLYSNGYKSADLLMEQVALCGLVGHVEFIQRSWFAEVLKRQTPEGCFDPQYLPQRTPIKSSSKLCDKHYTAVVAGAFGSAVRYILETYY